MWLSGVCVCGSVVCVCVCGRQGLDFLDEEGVRFHHDDQRNASSLLDAAHQAWVVHHLGPLAQSGRCLTATIRAGRREEGKRQDKMR